MKEYLEYTQLLGVPPLLMVAEYALSATNSYEHFSVEKSYEWVENRIIDLLYHQSEMESYNYSGGSYDPYGQFPEFPATNFIEELDKDEATLTRFMIFIKEISKQFHYLYAHLPFPEEFHSLDPFYDYTINLLNPETALLEIKEKEDVEFFNELFT